MSNHTTSRVRVQRPHAVPLGFELADEETGLNQVCQDATEANARRLAACWNACDGMSTEDVEACPDGGLLHLAEFANEMVLQRDALLEALRHIEGATMDLSCDRRTIREAARAAIAATEPAVAADLAYNTMKTNGALQRREADRALAEQVKWEAP